MSARSNWEGFLRFNLVSVPVRAYSATVQARGKIGFHLLHKGCNERIRYQKVCPVHGEVTKDEIVSGYEYAKGEYVIVDPDELEKMRTPTDKAINVDTFIRPEALDPIYYTERSYYLVPGGNPGQKPFAMLHKVMSDEGVYAVGQVVFAGRNQLVLVRPVGELLVMTMLSYDSQIKKSSTFEDEVSGAKPSAKELALAKNLVEAATADEFDFSQYQDTYTNQLRELIEAKAAGRKLVAPRSEEQPQVINLMDALRRSLNEAKKHRGRGEAKSGRSRKPPRPDPALARRRTG